MKISGFELKRQQLSREERKQEFTWKSRRVASWYDEDYADGAATNTANADELCTSSATAKPTINALLKKYSKWLAACFKIFRYWKWHIYNFCCDANFNIWLVLIPLFMLVFVIMYIHVDIHIYISAFIFIHNIYVISII